MSWSSGLPPPISPLPARVRHESHGASIELPREWEDDSVFSAHPPGPAPQPSISLVHATVAADTSLELHASRKVAEVSSVVNELRVDETRETTLGAQRAIALRVRFEADGVRFVQLMMLTLVTGGGRSIVYMLTGFAIEAQAMKLQVAFDTVAHSFRLSLPSRTLPGNPR